MSHQVPSRALSEQEFDISGALAAEDIQDGSISKDDFPRLEAAYSQEDRLDRTTSLTNEIGGSSDGDDEAFIASQQAASNRKSSNVKCRSVKKGGGFQTLGMSATLLKAVTRKGFSVPTPIQRKTIPLILDNQDVVGMARTGSGKTAAFVIPMIERLKTHSAKVGARAMIMSPSRELALQTLKAVKEFGRGTNLRAILLVGGDSLEDQFSQMSSNPDIIIATPGRFLHLLVEMSLDLSSVRYVVFDEADRLFEMGFATQLTEILHALPPSRQTLLFSATLPKSLVEFARAGLREPSLIRLDAESKISSDLESAFLAVKIADKEGALLHVLHDVIKMPASPSIGAANSTQQSQTDSRKRKRESAPQKLLDLPTAYSTIVFVATKHHVEYLSNLLRLSGFGVSYVYGSLDQTARKMQVENFRNGSTTILIVTDVAARGIDIPLLANVINYDFPAQSKIFVHRVGRTARAGRKGWSYSLVQNSDIPYLLDLQLFLSKKLVIGRTTSGAASFAEDMVLGRIPRTNLEKSCEWVTKLLEEDEDLQGLHTVASKGEKLYARTRNAASAESAQRAKNLSREAALQEISMLYKDAEDSNQVDRDQMLARISVFRPAETVFEVGKRGDVVVAAQSLRRKRDKAHSRLLYNSPLLEGPLGLSSLTVTTDDFEQNEELESNNVALSSASENELEVTFLKQPDSFTQTTADTTWRDSEHFMSYQPRSTNLAEERAYGVQSGSYNTSKNSNFVDAVRGATMDLNNDESRAFAQPSRPNQMRWDKNSKKYVSKANDEDGSWGAKMISGESGQKIAASFRSGRFQAWKKSNRIDRLPKTGEAENAQCIGRNNYSKNFKHYAERAPKKPDKYRDDFYKKRKKLEETKSKNAGESDRRKTKSELRGINEVHRQRQLQQKRKEKNARPSNKRKA